MRNDNQRVLPAAKPSGEEGASTARGCPRRQPVRGIAGQLRPYRDLRAGFETWRRVALSAWAVREENDTVH